MNQEDRPTGIDNPEKIATPPRIPKSDVEMFRLDPNMTPDGRDHVRTPCRVYRLVGG